MKNKGGWVLLDEDKVRKMRATKYFRGMYAYFSRLYGIEFTVVRKAALGQTWKQVK